jgi:ribosomal protein L32
MVAEVFAGLTAIKTAFDLAKGLKDIDDTTRRNAAVIELQEKILFAQAAQLELVEMVSELKKRVVELETWDADKKRYELKDIWQGSLAYVVKESMGDSKTPHNICANCFERGHKRYLQPRLTGFVKELFCSECNTAIIVGSVDIPSQIMARPKPPRF